MDVGLADMLQVADDFADRAVAGALQAEHPADLAERDLDADARQEAGQHGAREKIREKAEPDDAGHEQEGGRHQGEQARQGDVLVGAGGREAGEAGGEDCGGRGVGAHHEVSGRPEHGEQHHRDEHGVKAGDRRRAGDLGVTQHLGDRERRKGETGDDLGGHLRTVDRQQALEQRRTARPSSRF